MPGFNLTLPFAQTILRTVVGRHGLDKMLTETMKRAVARQAETKRKRRSQMIAAEGELRTSGIFALAADAFGRSPTSVQLRYLQTLSDIAVKNSTIKFPLPMNFIKAVSKFANLEDK